MLGLKIALIFKLRVHTGNDQKKVKNHSKIDNSENTQKSKTSKFDSFFDLDGRT